MTDLVFFTAPARDVNFTRKLPMPPRIGETVVYGDGRYEVTDVIWKFPEDDYFTPTVTVTMRWRSRSGERN